MEIKEERFFQHFRYLWKILELQKFKSYYSHLRKSLKKARLFGNNCCRSGVFANDLQICVTKRENTPTQKTQCLRKRLVLLSGAPKLIFQMWIIKRLLAAFSGYREYICSKDRTEKSQKRKCFYLTNFNSFREESLTLNLLFNFSSDLTMENKIKISNEW